MQDPRTMTYAEIVREIRTTRDTIREKGQRIYELSRVLHDRVRRSGAEEYTSRYVAFVMAHTRFVGGVEQGLQRVASFDRMVLTIQNEREAAEKARKSETPRVKKSVPLHASLADLAALFGQDLIDDATR